MRTTAKDTTRKATALTLVLALGVAVYLNWEYARAEPIDTGTPAQSTVETAASVDLQEVLIETEGAAELVDQLMTEEETLNAADKTYGEAQLVSVSKDSGAEFFEQARLSRSKNYDDAIDKIRKALKNASLTEAEKQELTQQLTACLGNLTLENEIETLVRAKGFADCVCFLQAGSADLTVMTGGDVLNAAQVAQLRDIVLAKCTDLSAQDITVVEVK